MTDLKTSENSIVIINPSSTADNKIATSYQYKKFRPLQIELLGFVPPIRNTV